MKFIPRFFTAQKLVLMAAFLLLQSVALPAQDKFPLKIAKLQYDGGGDWYANPTSVPNLIDYIQKNTNIQLDPSEYVVKPGGTQIFQYPFVHWTGHGNVSFSDEEARNLRNYLTGGGFLHVDDNYGMDQYVRREMKKVFPELEFIEVPWEHRIYHCHFEFESGIPKIHEHDGKPAKGYGLFWEGRLVCFYSYETDLGDGWEDEAVHNDPPEKREAALRMGANIVVFALTQ